MNRTSWLVLTLLATLVLVFSACSAASSGGSSQPVKQDTKPEVKSESKQQPAPEPKAEAKPATKQEPAPAIKPQLVKVKAAYVSSDGTFMPLWITKEGGFFEKNGLDVELSLVSSGPTIGQSLLAGDFQFVMLSSTTIVQLDLAGADAVLIATSAPIMPYQLMASKSINSPKDLKGKKLVVSRIGSASYLATVRVLKELGLKANDDVAIVQGGEEGARLAAMQSGAADGGLLAPPVSQSAEKMGMKVLVDVSDMKIDFEQTDIATTRKYVSANEDVVKRFVKAYVEGINYYKTQKEFSANVLKKYLKIEDQGALEASYTYFDKIIPRVPYISEKGIQTALEQVALENPGAANAKPSQFFDNRFVKELDDSGYINKLYQK